MILAALLEETFVRDFAIGEGNLTQQDSFIIYWLTWKGRL